jgi:hypothetical protein
MIDMGFFNEVHNAENALARRDRIYLPSEEFELVDPPRANFLLTLPSTIQGFGFHNKKWS